MRTQVTQFLPQMNNCESQVYTTATPPLERLSSHEKLGIQILHMHSPSESHWI